MAKLKNKLSLLIIGLIIGILVYFCPSFILSFLVLLSIFAFLGSRPQKEKNTLTKIIMVALILRLIFFTISMFIIYGSNMDISKYPVLSKIIGHTGQVLRDFDREIKNGIRITRYLKGEFGDIPFDINEISRKVSVGGWGFLHSGAWTQGILNYIFGFSVINLLLFPLIDLWSIIILYYLAKLLFDEQVASFPSFIYAIMPSSIVIACTNMRFSLSIFSFLLMTLFLVRFSKRNNFKYLIIIAIGFIIFMHFREKAVKPLLIIAPLILLLALNIRFRIKFVLILIVVFLFVLLNKGIFMQSKLIGMLQDIIITHTSFSNEPWYKDYSNYRIYDEFIYSHEIAKIPPLTLIKVIPKALSKGIIYFMFVPFPWETANASRLYYYPQIIFWYFIIPFALLGILRSLFFKTKETLPVTLLYSYFIIVFSLVLGNEGITARYRELITPFFYIFASAELCNLLGFLRLKKGTEINIR